MQADRRLCLDRSQSRLVEEGDMEAAFLLAATGQPVPADAVKRLGLEVWSNGRVMQGPEPMADRVVSEPVMPPAEPVAPLAGLEPTVPPEPEPIIAPESKRSRKKV